MVYLPPYLVLNVALSPPILLYVDMFIVCKDVWYFPSHSLPIVYHWRIFLGRFPLKYPKIPPDLVQKGGFLMLNYEYFCQTTVKCKQSDHRPWKKSKIQRYEVLCATFHSLDWQMRILGPISPKNGPFTLLMPFFPHFFFRCGFLT